MRTIAIMNLKGGVGKTTATVNISAALAAMGARVCVVDIDSQAHTTAHFGVHLDSQENAKSVYDVLIGKSKIAEIRHPIAENLWLIPAHLDMVGAELNLASVPGRELILKDELAEDNFPVDYLIIDCPPSLGLFSMNALTAVQEVIVPIQPHYLPLNGFGTLTEGMEHVAKRLNKTLRLSGVFFNIVDHTKLATEVIQSVADFFSDRDKLPAVCRDAVIFDTKIRRNIKLAEAPSHGKSIFDYDPHSIGAEDYNGLAAEIAEQSRR